MRLSFDFDTIAKKIDELVDEYNIIKKLLNFSKVISLNSIVKHIYVDYENENDTCYSSGNCSLLSALSMFTNDKANDYIKILMECGVSFHPRSPRRGGKCPMSGWFDCDPNNLEKLDMLLRMSDYKYDCTELIEQLVNKKVEPKIIWLLIKHKRTGYNAEVVIKYLCKYYMTNNDVSILDLICYILDNKRVAAYNVLNLILEINNSILYDHLNNLILRERVFHNLFECLCDNKIEKYINDKHVLPQVLINLCAIISKHNIDPSCAIIMKNIHKMGSCKNQIINNFVDNINDFSTSTKEPLNTYITIITNNYKEHMDTFKLISHPNYYLFKNFDFVVAATNYCYN